MQWFSTSTYAFREEGFHFLSKLRVNKYTHYMAKCENTSFQLFSEQVSEPRVVNASLAP